MKSVKTPRGTSRSGAVLIRKEGYNEDESPARSFMKNSTYLISLVAIAMVSCCSCCKKEVLVDSDYEICGSSGAVAARVDDIMPQEEFDVLDLEEDGLYMQVFLRDHSPDEEGQDIVAL